MDLHYHGCDETPPPPTPTPREPWTVNDWIKIIVAVTVGISSIISAWSSLTNKTSLKEHGATLEEVRKEQAADVKAVKAAVDEVKKEVKKGK